MLLAVCPPQQESVHSMLPVLHKYNFVELLDECREWLLHQPFRISCESEAAVLR